LAYFSLCVSGRGLACESKQGVWVGQKSNDS
jgi:hypothetical protein